MNARIADRYTVANYATAQLRHDGAPERIWSMVRIAYSTAVNPRTIQVPVAERVWKDTAFAITTPEGLRNQGRMQKHCVGGFVADCLHDEDNLHVYAIGSPEGDGSTLGIRERAGVFTVYEHEGKERRGPSASERRMARTILANVRIEAESGRYRTQGAREVRITMRRRNGNGSGIEQRLYDDAGLHAMAPVCPMLTEFGDGTPQAGGQGN